MMVSCFPSTDPCNEIDQKHTEYINTTNEKFPKHRPHCLIDRWSVHNEVMPHQSAPCNNHAVKISFRSTTQKWIHCLLNNVCLFAIAELLALFENRKGGIIKLSSGAVSLWVTNTYYHLVYTGGIRRVKKKTPKKQKMFGNTARA